MSEFLDIGEKSYYVWKNTSHIKLMAFLEKYVNKEDIKEYINTGEIIKFRLIEDFTNQQYKYNEVILDVFRTFHINDKDKKVQDYDYYRDHSINTTYTFQFIKYLLSTDQINIDTYNVYFQTEYERVLIDSINANSVKESYQDSYKEASEEGYSTPVIDNISNSSYLDMLHESLEDSKIEAEKKDRDHIDIRTILNENYKLIFNARREILLQLEILKGNDFIPLVEQATKEEIQEVLRPFLIKWISKKYNKNYTKTKEIIGNVSNFKKINIQEIVELIENI